MHHLLISILIIFSTNYSAYCSYRYVGCYTEVFLDSYFTASFMEPTLCFRLCDTPVIYLQGTVCRCAGGGLLNYNQQDNKFCNTSCTKPVDRSREKQNTCGGKLTYSAYALDYFYTLHGHLFNYQIQFSSCELWKTADPYDTSSVKLSNSIARSSLNKLEQCAAACLDQNATTKSIGFNGDSDTCICIMPVKASKVYDRKYYVENLQNTSCDLLCNNTYEGAKTVTKFKCGSSNNSKVWAIYDLNGTCPVDFAYISEINKCISTYRSFWNSCSLPSTAFIYDGNITWDALQNIIAKLQLNASTVSITFDENVVINSTWKCPNVSTSISYNTNSLLNERSSSSIYSSGGSSYYTWNTAVRYILQKGCLVESSYSSFVHRYSNRLCVTNPIDKFSSVNSKDETYVTSVNPDVQYCPTEWFDLNGRCYRISEEAKTIEQARNSCISVKSTPSNTSNQFRIPSINNKNKLQPGNELNDSPTGTIVEYIGQWQARLAFFLLDTEHDHDNDSVPTGSIENTFYDYTSNSEDSDGIELKNHHIGGINEFQIVNSAENDTANSTCLVIKREITEEKERPIVRITQTNNCSQPRHVLCETNTLIVPKFQYSCFSKPNIFDLPALISKTHLTHEFCLSICQELQTPLAILHINKCYCMQMTTMKALNITTDFQKFRKKTCGNPCPGNSDELCGDDNTIVVFQILESRRTFTTARTPPEPYPLYSFDSCIHLTSFNQTTTYKFRATNKNEFHPRYCLSLCTKYEQKYALINGDQCLCTNNPIKSENSDADILTGQDCSRPCESNYFYSCGNQNNASIYSMYLLRPKCRHGFEVAENDQQCVYSHFSVKKNSVESAQAYCQSIGGALAAINDILEIQDILPESILHTRLLQRLLATYNFRFVNDTRYYWLNRTTKKTDTEIIPMRLLKSCTTNSTVTNKNCILIKSVLKKEGSRSSHERCIIESDDCSTSLAMPVCVDKELENKSTFVSPITDENQANTTIDIINSHECDDPNNEYDLIDDYCYKIAYDEVSWKDAQQICQRDKATIFVPEKSVTLQYIKQLFLRKKPHGSSGFVHIGVYYDTLNRTVIQNNASNDGDNVLTVPDSNAVYDLCEKTFHERYAVLMAPSGLTSYEQTRLKSQKIGCGYMDLMLSTVPVIRCDEIPCNRTAVVICQKFSTTNKITVQVKREYFELTPTYAQTDTPSPTTLPDTDSSISTDVSQTSVTELDSDNDSTGAVTNDNSANDNNININNDDDDDDDDDNKNEKSVIRDFAPLFLLLIITCLFILLGVTSVIINHRNILFRRVQNCNRNSVYSQLTSANEFDLN